jgi:hypothetical protein
MPVAWGARRVEAAALAALASCDWRTAAALDR